MHITQQRIVESQINILSFPGSRFKGVQQLTKRFQARTRMYPSIVLTLSRCPASRAGSDCAVRRQQSSSGSSASGSQVRDSFFQQLY